jgi:L-lactate dehydrogenase complex protein LldG
MRDPERNRERRREVLQAIRDHLAASAAADAVYAEQSHEVHLPASRRPQPIAQPGGSLRERFQHALEGVAGQSVVVADEGGAVAAVKQIISKHDYRRVAVSDSPLVSRIAAALQCDAEFLDNFNPAELFECHLGLTGAQWAVAETGTLVLESDREHHRLASLVPPAHIAVISAEQIRATLSEVLEMLSRQGKEELSRTVTFITGPSRTSDIELTLAIGVHGPASLHVIIIEEASLG